MGRMDISVPGDVLLILDEYSCVDGYCRFPYFDGTEWILRKDGDNWRVLYYSSEGAEDDD
ncbi:hypothetical protein MTBUT4_430020 [Magnetospirillum sp. UT-4]|nr:hypothetical protein MTBUT4_430020 [Magnetospirillum sp. UT-4]